MLQLRFGGLTGSLPAPCCLRLPLDPAIPTESLHLISILVACECKFPGTNVVQSPKGSTQLPPGKHPLFSPSNDIYLRRSCTRNGVGLLDRVQVRPRSSPSSSAAHLCFRAAARPGPRRRLQRRPRPPGAAPPRPRRAPSRPCGSKEGLAWSKKPPEHSPRRPNRSYLALITRKPSGRGHNSVCGTVTKPSSCWNQETDVSRNSARSGRLHAEMILSGSL